MRPLRTANNRAASETGNLGERVVVTKASPAITTKPGRTVVTGSALSDSAKLTSIASPTGTITFRLYDPHGHVVYIDHVKVSGNGISRRSVSCTWNSVHQFFQCNIKAPRGIRTGRANPYLITAFESVGAGSVRAPAVRRATTPNPEIVFF